MSHQLTDRPTATDRFAKWVRRLCAPIVLFWLAVTVLSNVLVPQLEVVGEEQNVALAAPDSPALQAFQRIGKVFDEFDFDSAAMVVLEGDEPLGADRLELGHQSVRQGGDGQPEQHDRHAEPTNPFSDPVSHRRAFGEVVAHPDLSRQ